jgi:hypothetical protein
MALSLSPEKALIFRITHRNNVPWILDHGLHCRKSPIVDPNFVTIGNPDLIEKRYDHPAKCAVGGTLGDYIPFYFTPCSPMLYNILTGWRGLRRREKEEIVVLVSSLHAVEDAGIPFFFTDRHALLALSESSTSLADLDRIDWPRLRNRDFRHDPDEPDKVDRYQAEALIYRHLPVGALLGIVCYNDSVADGVRDRVAEKHLNLKVATQSKWFFE